MDKLAILLARNDDRLVELTKKVERLIARLSNANGKPITLVDRAKATAWPMAAMLTATGLLWMVLEKFVR